MAQTPTWVTAAAGLAATAGHPNQFLGTHQASYIYSGGSLASSQTTGNGVFASSQTVWNAQSFTTGSSQTSVGYLQLQLATVGGSPTLTLINPLTVSIYASSLLGTPTGSALGSATLTSQYVYSSPFWVTVPLSVLGLTPSTSYQIVTSIVGTSGHYYTWQHSNQAAGSSTSTDGSTWTTQSYGLTYKVFNTGTTGQLLVVTEDSGAKWTQFGYDSLNRLSTLTEFTVGPTSTTYLLTTSTFTYTNGLLTAVS